MNTSERRWPGWIAVLVVLVVAALGSAAWLVAWRQSVPTSDVIPDIVSAIDLVRHGHLPVVGVLSSFRSWVPPGAAWMYAPGAALLRDVRLIPFPGTALLHLGTLAGIVVLARRVAGPPFALLAVVLYGCSAVGLFYAAPHAPRGEPCFVVWMTVCACRWVETRDARWWVGAFTVWAIGLYLFLETAPALLMLPALWVVYRAPLRTAWLLPAVISIGVIWMPYLQFEAGRGFADLRSQLLRQPVVTTAPGDGWCDPALAPLSGQDEPGTPSAGSGRRVIARLGQRGLAASEMLVANVGGPVPGSAALGALVLLIGMYGLAGGTGEPAPRHRRLLMWSGVGLVVGAALAGRAIDVLLPAASLTRVTQDGLMTTRLLMGAVGLVMAGAGLPHARAITRMAPARPGTATRALLIALAVPWLAMMLVVESGRLDRVGYLAPLQCVLLVAAFRHVRFGHPATQRAWTWAAAAATVLLVSSIAVTPPWQDAANDRDADEVAVIHRLADRMADARLQRASIGVVTGMGRSWGPAFVAADARYAPTALTTVVLAHRFGLENTNRCREGVSAGDRFRIVEQHPSDESWQFPVPEDEGFRQVAQVGGYALFERAAVR